MGPCLTGAYKPRDWRPVYREISRVPCTGDRIETFGSLPSLLQAPSLITTHYQLPQTTSRLAE